MKNLLFILILSCSFDGFGQSNAGQIFIENAEAYSREGDYENAIKEYDLALDLDSNDYVTLNERGCLKIKIGDNKGAMKDFQQAIKINPTFTWAFNNLGLLYKEEDRNRVAITMYNKAIEIDPYFAIGYYSRAQLFMSVGKYEKAIKDFNSAINNSPNVRSRIIPELLIGTGYENKGLGRHYYLAVLDRAKCKSTLGNTQDAVNELNEFINNNLGDSEGYFIRAIFYNFINEYEKAIKDFNRAIKLQPEEYKYYVERGLLYKALRRYGKAKNDFEYAIELDNTKYSGYLGCGWVDYFTSDYKSAIEHFKKAIKLDPDNAIILYYRGMSHIAIGDYERGCSDLNKAADKGYGQAFSRITMYCDGKKFPFMEKK